MPAKDPHTLEYKELEAFHHHEVLGKTIPDTAEIIGVSERSVNRMKLKPAWHDLTIIALEKKGHTLDDYAEKLLEMKDKQKSINIAGHKEVVDDNFAQITYLKEIALIYGIYAPQKMDLRHGIAQTSDTELAEELDEATKRYGVAQRAGEQTESTTDSEQVEGAVL